MKTINDPNIEEIKVDLESLTEVTLNATLKLACEFERKFTLILSNKCGIDMIEEVVRYNKRYLNKKFGITNLMMLEVYEQDKVLIRGCKRGEDAFVSHCYLEIRGIGESKKVHEIEMRWN